MLIDISNDYHVGLGSFVDKPTYPYSSEYQLKLVVNQFVANDKLFTIHYSSLYEFQGQPSACPNDYCTGPPFSYVHNVNLTNNDSDFIVNSILRKTRTTVICNLFLLQSGLDAIQTSANVDTPEGTFDAISQAVLCNELVGWRNDSLKILFIVTDAVAHSAGDGKVSVFFILVRFCITRTFLCYSLLELLSQVHGNVKPYLIQTLVHSLT